MERNITRTIIALSILVFGCRTASNNMYGTLIIVAVGNDGIIVAADSRSSVGNNANDIYGYFDSSQKIFKIKHYPITLEGGYTFDNKYFDKIVEEYNSLEVYPKNVLENMKIFMSFMAKKYPPSKYPNASTNQFFSAGYLNDTSYILWSNYTKGIYKLDSFITSSNRFDSAFRLSYRKTNCKRLAIIAETAINKYIKDLNLKKSGGPIAIIKITRDNQIITIQNDFSKNSEGQKKMQKY